MDNYVYIVSSVPELLKDWSFEKEFDSSSIIDEMKSLCSTEDNALIDSILDGFKGDRLCREFYLEMLKSKNHFIREYFTFDLQMRNAKVRFLNTALHREATKDMIFLDEDESELSDFEELPAIEKVLAGKDILVREKGLDDIMWEKVDSLIPFNLFDMDVILSIVVKLKIIQRWLILDENTGREYFKSLTDQMLSSYSGIEYTE